MRHILKAAAIILIVFVLGSCGARKVEVAPVAVPAGLLTCKPAPKKPSGEYTQRDVGVYVVGLHEAHADCESKLGAVRKALTE